MDATLADALRTLLTTRTVAALGTLHDGAPFVSMVPFALLDDASAFVVHVSGLAAHTRDLRTDPRFSLMVMEEPTPDTMPQALARLTVVGTAAEAPRGSAERDAAATAYLRRFPDAAPMLELGDFAFFTLPPSSMRWVGGFAQARTLPPSALAEALAGPPQE